MKWLRSPRVVTCLALVSAVVVSSWSGSGTVPLYAQDSAAQEVEKLQYGVEWRLVRAGVANLAFAGGQQASVKLKSEGLVARLYTVDDDYRVNYRPGYCAADSLMNAKEGRRHRETKITFDAGNKRANYLERDLLKDSTVLVKEIDVPVCVHDVLGALQSLRLKNLQQGQSVEFPISDGKKSIAGRVERQAKEMIKTSLGEFPSVRYEAFLFNGVLYGRKGRLFIWLTDDEQRIPVQIRVQLPFYIGTVELKLEKQERR